MIPIEYNFHNIWLWLEIIGFISGVMLVWLSSKQNILCWPVNMFNVSIYFFIFLHKGIYAEMSLQAVYFIFAIYGWYEWNKDLKNESKINIKQIDIKTFTISILSGITTTFILYFILDQYTDSTVPFLDAIATSFSIIATYLLTKKYLQSWLFWILIDILGVVLFVKKELELTALLYSIFIFLASFGYFNWKKKYKENQQLTEK